MARFLRALGRNRDIPQLETYQGVAATAGTGSDFEHIIAVLTDLSTGAASGSVGDLPNNTMSIRNITLTFESAITGANTDTCTFYVRQYRSGSLLASTTASTAVTGAGSATITPASMAGIFVGQRLSISGGTGTAETVNVTAVTSTTFSAVFANAHSSTYNIVQAPLVTLAFVSGTNAAAYTPISFSITRGSNTVRGGDVITIQRVSAGAGLATTAYAASIDWVPSGAS